MSKKIFTASENMKSEYACTVVKIGELFPIEGSDFLAQTYIGDASIVVRKDLVKTGDLLFYAPNESQLNVKFLGANNLFSGDAYELNDNAKEYEEIRTKLDKVRVERKKLEKPVGENEEVDTVALNKVLDEEKEVEAQLKRKCGFFSKSGRVRMIRLKKTPSMGYLFSLDEMARYCPAVANVNMEEYLNVDFDTVNGDEFIRVYVPPIPQGRRGRGGNKNGKRQKKMDSFDRMIPGEFTRHYDTAQLGKNMWLFKPNTKINASVKMHGTSVIIGNVKVKNPFKLPFFKRMFNKFVDGTGLLKSLRIQDYTVDYDVVYSSRNVIQNQYINTKLTAESGYYKRNVYQDYRNLIGDYIPQGMTLYGEICGYETDSATMIQKEYDYGCAVGENFIMPYRIQTVMEDGSTYECEVREVQEWTEKLIEEHPELKSRVHPIDILYSGTLGELYPDVNTEQHWNDNVLIKLINDKEHFGMELNEPMCKTKVPREGIVIRIDKDPLKEAFKLKTKAFYEWEGKQVSAGVVDREMLEGYADGDSSDNEG